MPATCIVVMPAFNEEACIGEVCREWLTMLEGVPGSRLLVVNDGSTDRTAKILDALAQGSPALTVVHQGNAGHGAAILHGYHKALEMGCEWVCQVDSDGQFEARDFAELWARARHCRFVLGYRRRRRDPLHRRALSAALRVLILVLFGAHIRDPNVPFRLMEARYLDELLARVPATAFAPNVFLSILARRCGRDFCEVQVAHASRRAGAGSLGMWRLLRLLPRCVKELLGFRSRLCRKD